jgi:glutamyl-tRNA reductase
MNFLVVGLSHKTAPLEIREKVSFSSSRLLKALECLKLCPDIEECLILSTCNRVEIYATTSSYQQASQSIRNFLGKYYQSQEPIDKYLYVYQNQAAIKHIFRVVSSLDSMIVGENQILHQVKQAYFKARDCGAAGKDLSLVFQKALNIGREIRALTEISRGVVSISSVAVELATKKLKDLHRKNILIIGAGKIGELTAKSLTDKGIKSIFVANRTYAQAISLAERFGGKAVKFDKLPEGLKEADIIISSTAAPHYILKYKDVVSLIEERNNKPLFIIDLGVPRNVEQRITDIDKVYLYNIDDLRKVSSNNLQERLKEAKKAEEIVEEETGWFAAQTWSKPLSKSKHIFAGKNY